MPTIDTDTEAGKAELQKIIDKETQGLKDKRDELLGKVKTLTDGQKAIQDQLDEIKAEKDAAIAEAAGKKGDVETIKKQLEEKHAKEIKKLTDERDALKSQREKLLIDGGLADALDKANVAPQFKDAVKALIRAGNKVEIVEGDTPSVTIDGKPMNEFVSGWAQGDQGKHYIAADDNSGGDTKAKGRTDPAKGGAKKKSEMSHVERADFINENGQDAYNALA